MFGGACSGERVRGRSRDAVFWMRVQGARAHRVPAPGGGRGGGSGGWGSRTVRAQRLLRPDAARLHRALPHLHLGELPLDLLRHVQPLLLLVAPRALRRPRRVARAPIAVLRVVLRADMRGAVMLASANPLIAYVGHMAESSAASPLGQNVAFFRHTFSVMLADCMSDNLRRIRNYFELSETEAANVSVASELQAMSAISNGFTNDAICVMLEAVCIE